MPSEPLNRKCELLEWDSGFFGLRIGRLTAPSLTQDEFETVRRWCAEFKIDCLYFLANADDLDTTTIAQTNAFRLVDVRVTLDRVIGEEGGETSLIRHFQRGDLRRLREIARTAHRDTRFYYDLRFPRALCDALYETWIQRSCDGWADAVLVADDGHGPCGYISCHQHDAGSGSIGLCAVAEDSRGKGVGVQLVRAALRYFKSNTTSRVTVVTQARNVGAQRMYQRCGFTTRRVQLSFHRWFDAGEAL